MFLRLLKELCLDMGDNFSKNLSSSPPCGYENPSIKKISKNHDKFEEKRVKLKYEIFPYLASFLAEAHKDSSGGGLQNNLKLSPIIVTLELPFMMY